MNPLIRTVRNMAVAANAEGNAPKFSAPYHSTDLVNLSNYLLRNAGASRRLTQEKKAGEDAVSVVILSCGVFSTIVLFRELLLGRKVAAIHFDRGPATDLAMHLQWGWDETSKPEEESPLLTDLRMIRQKSPSADLDILGYTWPLREAEDEEALVGHWALDPMVEAAAGAELAAELGASRVVFGYHSYNFDLRFARSMSSQISHTYGTRIRVEAPLQDLRPEQAVCAHLDLGFSKDVLLEETWSCDGEAEKLGEMCGVCWGCYRRWRVFTELGWIEKHFTKLPPDGPTYEEYAQYWEQYLRS